jgi:ketosteroid isomerase-like protein
MADERVSDADLDHLIERVRESTSAFIGGDMRRYFALVNHAEDFTLMPPTGGPTVHGQEVSDEILDEMERFFRGGEATVEIEQTYTSGDLAVVVVVERQRGVVGDYQEQDWSLRVTLVFRREGSDWRLAHRHADALVHPISFDLLSELARGLHGPDVTRASTGDRQ